MRTRLRPLAAACCVVCASASGWAPPALAASEPAQQLAAASTDTTLTVNRFEPEGTLSIPVEELQSLLAPWRNRPLQRDDLDQAARAIERHYQRVHRRLARVSWPAQDVTDGTVRLRIAEGQLGRVVVQADGVRAIAPDRAVVAVLAAQPPGQALSLATLEQTTMLLDEWPGLQARSSLVAGDQPGQTNVALALTDRRSWDMVLRADNEGARSTGRSRVSMDGRHVLAGGGGQAINVGALLSEGSRMLKLSTSLPLKGLDWRASVYGSALDYRLVSPEFNALDVKGPSNTLGASINWSAVRSAGASTDVSANLEQRRVRNKALNTVLSDYRVDALTLRYAHQAADPTGNRRDAWDLSMAVGQVRLDGSPNQLADAQTARTAGGYAVWRGAWQRLQAVSPTQRIMLRTSGQWSAHNLDVSERMPIAGPSGVRGYPVGEATGSRALLASAEWQQGLSAWAQGDLTWAAFADAGVAAPLANTGFAGAPAINRLKLGAAGLWLEWRATGMPVAVRVTAAQPLGAHPNPTAAGSNQDGSSVGTRWWASLQWAL